MGGPCLCIVSARRGPFFGGKKTDWNPVAAFMARLVVFGTFLFYAAGHIRSNATSNTIIAGFSFGRIIAVPSIRLSVCALHTANPSNRTCSAATPARHISAIIEAPKTSGKQYANPKINFPAFYPKRDLFSVKIQ